MIWERKTTVSKMTSSINSGSHSWSAPSNIALVKYWGKKPVQLPANASLSFTLNKSKTIVKTKWEKCSDKEAKLVFTFEGKETPSFNQKIQKWYNGLKNEMSFLNQLKLTIDSTNTFPHSAGIASSASSMAALSLSLMDLANTFGVVDLDEAAWLKMASSYARLGSGSAARSVYPVAATWGLVDNEFASPVQEIHLVYKDFGDAILIVDSGTKAVSSSLGHELMNKHPYRDLRFAMANKRVGELVELLKKDDFEHFSNLVEVEALELHSMMMTSNPSFILMKPKTLEIIDRVRKARANGHEICFTLDAGPNIHLLYPQRARDFAMKFVSECKSADLFDQGQWIDDQVGSGPTKEA